MAARIRKTAARYNDSRQMTIDFGLPEPALRDDQEQPAEKPRQDAPAQTADDNRLYYISFGSGSSGNACYIGNATGGIIVDAGVRADVIEETLKKSGISMSHVRGIIVTHDHSDHIRYAYPLLRNNRHLKIFCTNRVLNGMLRRHSISKRIKEYHYPIFKEIPFKVGGFEITAFDVPHDGSDNMGFSIDFQGRRFVVATDLGEVAGRARYYIEQANYLMIEANYDAQMLRNGPYPEYLKARIATSHGHMDNADTAVLLQEIINPALRYIFLCHLSEDNNTPEQAVATIRQALLEKRIPATYGTKKQAINSGTEKEQAADNNAERQLIIGDCTMSIEDRAADVSLMPLPRFEPTPLFIFRP